MTEDLKKQKKDETQRAHKSEDAVLKEEPETAAEKKRNLFATEVINTISLIWQHL